MRNLFYKTRRSFFLSNFFRSVFYFINIFFAFTLPLKAQWYGALIPDFKVNDDLTTYNQQAPYIGVDGTGNFNIVWGDRRNTLIGLPVQVYCQRFAFDGTRLGINFRIGQDTAGGGPITILNDGRFIVTWAATVSGKRDIYCQKFFSNGTQNGAILKVSDTTTTVLTPSLGDIGADSSGNFIIVWTDYRNGTLNPDCYGQRYDSSGTRIGNNFKINDNVNNSEQLGPKIAINKDGSYNICWVDWRSTVTGDIYLQRYNRFGDTIGINQRVDDDINNFEQRSCDIATDGNGYLAIVFDDYREISNTPHAYYQLYDTLGNKIGINRKADENTGQTGAGGVLVSMQANGQFVIIWSDARFNNNIPFAQRFQKDGTKFGVNFKIPELNSNINYGSKDVFLSDDKIYTTWEDTRNGNYDIFANIKSFINPDSILSTVNTQNEIAIQYRLYPAYPNPFNPTVNIKYKISELTNVILRIIDINGKEVTTLLNRKQSKGLYEIPFDGANYASGIYFVELTTETGFKGITKIILLK